jgi:hypothetical protein
VEESMIDPEKKLWLTVPYPLYFEVHHVVPGVREEGC